MHVCVGDSFASRQKRLSSQMHVCVGDSFADSCDRKKQSRDSVAAERRRLDAHAAQSPWPHMLVTHTWEAHTYDAHILIVVVLHSLCPQPVAYFIAFVHNLLRTNGRLRLVLQGKNPCPTGKKTVCQSRALAHITHEQQALRIALRCYYAEVAHREREACLGQPTRAPPSRREETGAR